MIETYAASQAAGSLASAGTSKEGKNILVPIGCAVVVILAIIDSVLLYLVISAPPATTSPRKNAKQQKNSLLEYSYSAEDPPLEDFPDHFGTGVGRQNSAGRLCSTPACAWLDAYLGDGVPDAKEPCDDFYAHVCAQHQRSIYADGRARLMAAVKGVLLENANTANQGRHIQPFWREYAAVLERCLGGSQSLRSAVDVDRDCEERVPQDCPSKMPEAPASVSNKFFRENSSATLDDFAAFIRRVVAQSTLSAGKETAVDDVANRGNGSIPSSLPKQWMRWACRWVSLAARCHMLNTTKLSAEKILAYQRVWKTIYFAPFMGQQAEPLLELVYRDPPAPRLQACLSLMVDAFEDETLAATKAVLTGTIDDLENFLSELGRDTLEVVRKFFRFTTGQADVDAEYLAFPRDLLSEEKNDLVTTLLGASDSAGVNMTLFSSQARIVYKGRQRRLLVAPGLLGVLVNFTSGMGPVLLPTLWAPVVRAFLSDRLLDEAQGKAPSKLVGSVAQCLATRLNMTEALSMATATEAVALEQLFQLYRKRLANSDESGTVLHPSYTNRQLFFVLWALGYCGEDEGATVVNAVAGKSGRFAKEFQCTPDAATFALEKCSLNAVS